MPEEVSPAMRGITCAKCGKQAVCLYTDATQGAKEEEPYCLDCIFAEYPNVVVDKFKPCVISSDNEAAIPQPPPEGSGSIVLPFVLEALKARAEFGFKKYGTYLRTHNGRDALMDAFQEILDLTNYLAQLILERDK